MTFISKIASLIVVFAASAASAGTSAALSCSGTELGFTLSRGADASALLQVSQVRGTDQEVVRDILRSNRKGITGPRSATFAADGFTAFYEGTFASPSPHGIGAWHLLINEQSGAGRVDWDNDDGGMLSFDVICL